MDPRIADADWGPRATFECTLNGVRYRAAAPGETAVAWVHSEESGRIDLVRIAPPVPTLLDKIRAEIAAPLEARIAALEADRRYYAEVLDHLLERSLQQSGTNVDLRVRMNDLEHRIKPPVLSAALATYHRQHEGA